MSETINGISFENETPENLNTFRLLTSKLDILDRPIPSQTRNFRSSCKSVSCALKQIFGETSTQLHYLNQKFGFNGSHLSYDGTSPWKKRDLDVALLAINDYPDGLFPLEPNKRFVRAANGTGEEGVYANATITVFDHWDTQTNEQKRATIFHELAHNVSGMSKMDESERWKAKSGWENTTKIVNGKKVTISEALYSYTIVSNYGMTNEWEDFAESVVAYRYNPKALQEVDPDKFTFMKKFVFDNVEYTSQKACSQPQRMSNNLKRRAEELANAWVPRPTHLQAISKNCSSLVFNELAQKGSISLSEDKFTQCYQNEISKFAQTFLQTQLKDDSNKDFLEVLIKNVDVNITPTKMQGLVSEARQHHTQTLRTELLKASSQDFACAPTSAQYAYQNYDEKVLGIDSYQARDVINKVNQIFCTTVQKHSPTATVQGMLK